MSYEYNVFNVIVKMAILVTFLSKSMFLCGTFQNAMTDNYGQFLAVK